MAFEFRKATLPNGLTVIAETSGTAHTAAVGFFVKTGARDEPTPLMGVSHFLEHMVFKGTERRSAVDVIADIMRPALRQADFDEEKGVILEEIAMYDDNPFWRLWEHANDRYFGAHPLGHRVLGTRDSVRAMTRDQMQAYFDERYTAGSTVVCAAGKVDFDALVAQVAAQCGGWRAGTVERKHPAFHPHEERTVVRMKQANRAYLSWMCPAPALADPRRYAASMVTQILGDTEGSRLYWALVETGVAEEAQAQYDGHDGLGEYVTYAACRPEDADRVEEIVRKEMDDYPLRPVLSARVLPAT